MTKTTPKPTPLWVDKKPTYSIKLRLDRPKGKEFPVIMKFSFKGIPKKIDLKRTIEKTYWTGKAGNWISYKHPYAEDLNFFFMQKRLQAKGFIERNLAKRGGFYYSEFRKEIQSPSVSNMSAIDNSTLHQNNNKKLLSWSNYHQLFIKKMKVLVVPTRIRHFNSYCNKLLQFDKTIQIDRITVDFLNNYKYHLLHTVGNNINTTSKSLAYIRQVLNQAINDRLIEIEKSPFKQGYQLNWKRPKPVFLNFEEVAKLEKLYNSKILVDKLQNVLQYFLFSVYTGMDFGDIRQFCYKDIEKFKGQYIVNRSRSKEEQFYIVRLNEKATHLITKLKSLDSMNKTEISELVFRVISNSNTNKYLEKIMSAAHINKPITFHKARHTFATLSHALGVPKQMIQHALGHSNSRMTDQYTHIEINKFLTAFQSWDKL